MASNKYLDKTGLQKVAGYVNAKLTFCSTMPESPVENQLVLYVGATTSSYTRGGIYKYSDSEWELLNLAKAINYVDTLPSSDIEDIIYGVKGYNTSSETIADGFLDENELFEKTTAGDGYSYTPASGIIIEASTDGSDYIGFTSLEYDGTSDWTLTFDDETDVTLADGDTFYFRQPVDKFYAGDATNQKIIPFASSGGGGGDYIPGDGIKIDGQTISVKPATSTDLGGVIVDDDTVVVNENGILSGNYKGGYGINVDGNEVSAKTFVGAQSEWNNLTSAQKAKFDTVSITDDAIGVNNTPGHAIIDAEDTEFPQRTSLKIEGASVTDDSANDITKVTVTPYTGGRGIDIEDYEVAANEKIATTFTGTQAEWDALTTEEKAEFDIVNITDDPAGGEMVVVDTVEDGNLNPVTSNAVFDAFNDEFIFQTVSDEYTYSTGQGGGYTLSKPKTGYALKAAIVVGTNSRVSVCYGRVTNETAGTYSVSYQDILNGTTPRTITHYILLVYQKQH